MNIKELLMKTGKINSKVLKTDNKINQIKEPEQLQRNE